MHPGDLLEAWLEPIERHADTVRSRGGGALSLRSRTIAR